MDAAVLVVHTPQGTAQAYSVYFQFSLDLLSSSNRQKYQYLKYVPQQWVMQEYQ